MAIARRLCLIVLVLSELLHRAEAVCGPGRFQDRSDFQCKDCAIGRFQEEDSNELCQLCPLGRYVGTTGNKACTKCPAGYESPVGSTELWQCKSMPAYCGNGLREGIESCDDGNRVSGDGCSADCVLERGFACSYSTALGKELCEPPCGDYLIRGAEMCDDGNSLSGDGCSSSCKVETGFLCEERQATVAGSLVEVSVCDLNCTKDADEYIGDLYPCTSQLQPPSQLPVWCFPDSCINEPPPAVGVPSYTLGCGPAVQSHSLTCMKIESPLVTKAVLDASGSYVDVEIDHHVHLPSQKSVFVCNDVFLNAATFGADATCSQRDAQTIRIRFGSRPSIGSYSSDLELQIRKDAVVLDVREFQLPSGTGAQPWPSQWMTLKNKEQTVKIQLPPPTTFGFGKVSAEIIGQKRAGAASEIVLDGTSSKCGSGIFGCSFSWTLLSVDIDSRWTSYVRPGDLMPLQNSLFSWFNQSLNGTRSEPVAAVHVETQKLTDLFLAQTSGTPPTMPEVSLSFGLKVTSLFDGSTSNAVWSATTYPFYKVPLLIIRSPLVQTLSISSALELLVSVEAPTASSESIPSFALSWTLRFPNGTVRSASEYVDQSNPGLLHVPHMSMPTGRCEFNVICTYHADGKVTAMDPIVFKVHYTKAVPIAVIEGPHWVGAACPIIVSAARSFDPGLRDYHASGLVRPLPQASYEFKWKCDWIGPRAWYVDEAQESLRESWFASSQPCGHGQSSHSQFSILGGRYASNSLIRLQVRVVRGIGDASVTSAWATLFVQIRQEARPAVTFPVIPALPVNHGEVFRAWALIENGSPGCPAIQQPTASVVDVATGRNISDGPSGPALEIVRMFNSFNDMPDMTRESLFPEPGGLTAYQHRTSSFFWLRLHTNLLQPGGKYRLALRAQSATLSMSDEFEVNIGPVGGTLTVSPLHGQAVSTMFRMSVNDWQDANMPISFAFWRRPADSWTMPGMQSGLNSSDELLVDYSQSASVSLPLSAGTLHLLNRARDAVGSESAMTLVSKVVHVSQNLHYNDEKAESLLRGLNNKCTEPSQQLGAVAAIAATVANRSDVPFSLTEAALASIQRAQEILRGRGSRPGAVRMAELLKSLTQLGRLGTDSNVGSIRATAVGVLKSTLGRWEAAANSAAPVGMPHADAKQFVTCASNLVALQLPGNLSNTSIEPSPQDGNILESLARKTSYEIAQYAIATNALPPANVQAAHLSVGAFVLTSEKGVTTTPLPENPSAQDLLQASAARNAMRVTVDVNQVGKFRMPRTVLSNVSSDMQEMGYETSTATSIVGVHRWSGNPFGPNSSSSLSTEGHVVTAEVRSANGPPATINGLEDPILMWLPMAGQNKEHVRAQFLAGVEPICRFWDPVLLTWAGDGCKILGVRKGGTEMLCSCTHLTSFGAFATEMIYDFGGEPDPPVEPEAAKAPDENPILPIVVLLIVLDVVWLTASYCRDLGKFSKVPQDIVWRMHFRDDPQHMNPTSWKPKKKKSLDEVEDPDAPQVSGKPFETGTDTLLLFLSIFRVMRTLQYFSFSDMTKFAVRSDIKASYQQQLNDVLSENQDALMELNDGQWVTARAAFRDERLRRRLRERLQEVTHSAILNKKCHIPPLPWSCSGFISIRCCGVHPWESRKPGREALGLDALVPVHAELDENGLSIYSVKKEVQLPWQGIPPPCWFRDHEQVPLIEASWSAILEHQAVRERDVKAELWGGQQEINTVSFEHRLERIAVGADHPRDLIDERVAEICEEYDRRVVKKQLYGEPLSSGQSLSPRPENDGAIVPSGEIHLAPMIEGFLDGTRGQPTQISEAGLETSVEMWEEQLTRKCAPPESALTTAFKDVGPNFDFWDLLQDSGLKYIGPAFRRAAMRLVLRPHAHRNSDEEDPDYRFEWLQMQNLKSSSGLDEVEIQKYASQFDAHVELTIYGLDPKNLVDFRETVLEFRARSMEKAAERHLKQAAKERSASQALPSLRWKAGQAHIQGHMDLRKGHTAMLEAMQDGNQLPETRKDDEGDPNANIGEDKCQALEEQWANALRTHVAQSSGLFSGAGTREPVPPGQPDEWEVDIAIHRGGESYLPAEHLGDLDWSPMRLAVCRDPRSKGRSLALLRIERPPGNAAGGAFAGVAVPADEVRVRRLNATHFPLPPLSKMESATLTEQLALEDNPQTRRILTEDDFLPGTGLDIEGDAASAFASAAAAMSADGESAFAGATAAMSAGDPDELTGDDRWERWENSFANGGMLGSADPDPASNEDIDVGPLLDFLGKEELVELFVTTGQQLTLRALIKSSVVGFAAALDGSIQSHQSEQRFAAQSLLALADEVAPPKEEGAEHVLDVHAYAEYADKSAAKPKKKPSKAAKAASEALQRMKEKQRQKMSRVQALREAALASAFKDPNEETAEEFIDFQLRRFGFLYWSDGYLFGATLCKYWPVSRVFLQSWIGLLAMEQAVVFSISTFGSLAIAGALYLAGVMKMAEDNTTSSTVADAVTANVTATQGAWTTTTTTLAPDQKYNEDTKLFISLAVSVVSVVVAYLPEAIAAYFFTKPVHFEVVPGEAKKRILKHWRFKDKVGTVVSAALLLISWGVLIFFIFQSKGERENHFLLSMIINLAWKLVVWPGLVTCFSFTMVAFARRNTQRLDGMVESLLPYSTFDYSMFTSNDAADQARQFATIRSAYRVKWRGSKAASEEEVPEAPAKPSVLALVAGVALRRLRKVLRRRSSS